MLTKGQRLLARVWNVTHSMDEVMQVVNNAYKNKDITDEDIEWFNKNKLDPYTKYTTYKPRIEAINYIKIWSWDEEKHIYYWKEEKGVKGSGQEENVE